MAHRMPLPLTVSFVSKIQIGFTFLVPAQPGSPGKRTVKRVYMCYRWTSSRVPAVVSLSHAPRHRPDDATWPPAGGGTGLQGAWPAATRTCWLAGPRYRRAETQPDHLPREPHLTHDPAHFLTYLLSLSTRGSSVSQTVDLTAVHFRRKQLRHCHRMML